MSPTVIGDRVPLVATISATAEELLTIAMPNVSSLLTHAQSAVERATRTLDELRARLDAAPEPMSAAHRLQAEQILKDLGLRNANLAHLYREMAAASAEQRPALWGRFFACYDDCLEGLREFNYLLGTKPPP